MPDLLALDLVSVVIPEALDADGDDRPAVDGLLADAPKATHAPTSRAASSTIASAISSRFSSASTLIRSPGSWLCSVPSARLVHEKPAASNELASEAPPESMCLGW